MHNLTLYLNAFKLLKYSERSKVFLLLLSSVFNGFLQLFALVGIIPFINLVVDSNKFLDSKIGKFIYQIVQINDVDHLLIFLAFSFIFIVLIKSFYAWFHVGLLAKFVSKNEIEIRDKLFKKIIFSKYEWIKKYESNYLREVLFNYSGAWATQFLKPILLLKNELIIFIFIVSSLIYVNPTLSLIVIFVSFFVGSLTIFIIKNKIYFLEEMKRNAYIKAAQLLMNVFHGIKDIKMYQSEKYFNKKFHAISCDASIAQAVHQQWAILPKLIIESFTYCMILFILIFLIFFENNLSGMLSTIGVYAFASIRIMPLVSSLIAISALLINVTPILKHFMKIINESDMYEIDNKKNIRLKKSIQFKNIFFKYRNNKDISLKNINFKLTKKHIYGIVGLSGSGKTTLIDLVCGILYPKSGEIIIDDKLVNKSDVKSFRNFIGYVGQQVYVFDGDIIENISFSSSKKNHDIEKAKKSLINAQLSSWVTKSKIKNIDLGEQGKKISGGQIQRLGIARIFYKEFDIVVIDEGTSALDGINENEIKKILLELKKNSIILMVAHRVSTIQICDQIFVVENGEITDKGSHKKLMSTNDFYQNVVIAQMIKN